MPRPDYAKADIGMSETLVDTWSEERVHGIPLARPAKRNAINDRLLEAIEAALRAAPEGTRAIVALAPLGAARSP